MWVIGKTFAAESPVENLAALDADISNHEIHINLAPRHYRIRGQNKNLSYEQLKIYLLIQQGEALPVDTFDRYNAKARAVYIKQAAEELGIPTVSAKESTLLPADGFRVPRLQGFQLV